MDLYLGHECFYLLISEWLCGIYSIGYCFKPLHYVCSIYPFLHARFDSIISENAIQKTCTDLAPIEDVGAGSIETKAVESRTAANLERNQVEQFTFVVGCSIKYYWVDSVKSPFTLLRIIHYLYTCVMIAVHFFPTWLLNY